MAAFGTELTNIQVNVCYERTAEVRVYHNKRDGGLTLASDNQLGAGQILNHCFLQC
jgi:hypothetical protein